MRQDLLSRVPIFSELDPDELEQLLSEAESITARPREYVFRAGDPGDALYVVESGLLEVVIDEDTESERTLHTLFQGDYFGEIALLTQGPRTATIRVLVESKLIRISYGQFANLLETKPKTALYVSKVLSEYLSRTNSQLSYQASRLMALITIGENAEAGTFIERLAGSLEHQFERSTIVVHIGWADEDRKHEHIFHVNEIQSSIHPLPDGGQVLHLQESWLETEGDHVLISIINDLRKKFGNILVHVRPEQAFKRLMLFTRFHQCCLLYNNPHRVSLKDELMADLLDGFGARVRMAWFALPGNVPPSLPMLHCPPLKILVENGAPVQESVDRLARALAGKTIGLALSSGTAQGLAHLGVMRTLIREGIPIDLIAGTSGGALYGSMIASGLTVDDAVKRAIWETRRNLIDKFDFTTPKRGLIRGVLIERMIRSMLGDVLFEEAPIPLYAVAADLSSGEEVVLQKGLIYKGVRASISVPGIFEPYVLDGRVLVDGVVVNPLPVSVARSKGADIVIAVQVPAPGQVNIEASEKKTKRKHRFNMISSIIRSHHFSGERLADESARDADVCIKPDVTRFGWREYRAAAHIIAEGVRAGEMAIEQIRDVIQKDVSEDK